jgi:inorganic pyrophosphatase
LIAVSAESYRHKKVRSLEDLGEQLLSEIEQFFISYNAMHGKQFKPLGRHGEQSPKAGQKGGKAIPRKK